MPFQLSPGVAVVEKDYSSIVPAVSSSIGAFAGVYPWGPVLEPTTVSSENELVRRFGKPSDSNADSFFTAANFLSYTNNLLLVRADTGSLNAVATTTGGVSTVAISNAGAGYSSTAAAPAVAVSAPDIAGGTQATVTAVLSGGAITAIAVSNGGSGYSGAAPTVTITSTGGGSGATFTVATSGGVVTGITVTSGGTGYKGTVTATLSGGTGTGASAGAVTVGSSSISALTVTNPGTGYSVAPTVTVAAPPSGTTATATASVATGGLKIVNGETYTNNYINGLGVVGQWAAKYPGSIGNSIKVAYADSKSFAGWTYAAEFDGTPGTSPYAASVGGSNDELHVIVIDEDGLITGTKNAVLEKFAYLSKASDGKRSDGTNNYYKNVINGRSEYIWWMDNPTLSDLSTNWAASTAVTVGQVLRDGSDYYVVTAVTSASAHSTGLTAPSHTDGSALNGDVTLTYATDTNWGTAAANTAFSSAGHASSISLTGGTDVLTATDGQKKAAFALFANAELYDISLVMAGKASSDVASYIIQNICEPAQGVNNGRGDCVAFISPENTQSGDVIIGSDSEQIALINDYRNILPSSSYGVLDSGFKYQYDRYNDKYRYVPLNGDVAGLCARTDYTNDPWWSPGGLNRGQIKNVVRLAVNPNKTQRDLLYKNGVNPVVTFPGEGTVLFGDKTLLAKPSAFDRINVRRLFIVLEKAISTAAKYQLFEFNDGFTRAQFKNLVEPFLRDVQGRRGITDFVVKCDGSNNTGEVIDRNEFVADIFVKPNRSINFITLSFVAARSGINFSEVGA
jgi:hypothetical protein